MGRKWLSLLGLAFLATSCGNDAGIELHLSFTPDTEVVLTRMNAASEDVVDTLSFDRSGLQSVLLKPADDDPAFYNLYYRDRKIIPLILKSGDKVTIKSDTLGLIGDTLIVKGSEESERAIRLEKDFAKSYVKYYGLCEQLIAADKAGDAAALESVSYEMGKVYFDAKFRAMRQIQGRPSSLSSMSTLYHEMPDGQHLFEEVEDTVTYRLLYDSLSAAYPGLQYLELLENECKARKSGEEVLDMLSHAEVVGLYDIVMPDLEGRMRSLSELKGKTVLLYFYSFKDEKQLRLAQDFQELYRRYKDRGFEIFQVSTDIDKSGWAASVRNQKLPWINVCDSKGAEEYLPKYNVQKVPSLFVINKEGSIVDRDCFENLEKVIEKNL